MPRVALKRIAEPGEVAKVILFLFSEEAGYITGSVSPYLMLTNDTKHNQANVSRLLTSMEVISNF